MMPYSIVQYDTCVSMIITRQIYAVIIIRQNQNQNQNLNQNLNHNNDNNRYSTNRKTYSYMYIHIYTLKYTYTYILWWSIASIMCCLIKEIDIQALFAADTYTTRSKYNLESQLEITARFTFKRC